MCRSAEHPPDVPTASALALTFLSDRIDPSYSVGTLNKVLDIATENDWIIVDMKKDWKKVFPD